MTPTGSTGCEPRCRSHATRRPQPGRDDKVVTAWNGFAITALAEASVALDEPELLSAATTCARSIVDLHVVDGTAAARQPRRPGRRQRGHPRGPRRVGDRPADAATRSPATDDWLRTATGLLDDAHSTTSPIPTVDGRWFDTADDAEQLHGAARRSRSTARRPSGASLIAEALQLAAHLAPAAAADGTPSPRRRRWQSAHADPGQAAALGRALAGRRRGRGARTDPDRRRLRPASSRNCSRRHGTCAGRSDRRRRCRRLVGAARSAVTAIGGRDAAYVCRGRMCDLPVTTADGTRRRAGSRPCSVPHMSSAEHEHARPSTATSSSLAQGPGRRRRRALRDRRHRRGSRRRRGPHRPRQRFAGSTPAFRRARPKPRSSRCARSATRRRSSGALTIDLGERRDAHRDHQRDDVRRRGQDHVDEGLLGPGEHHPALANSARSVALARIETRRNRWS